MSTSFASSSWRPLLLCAASVTFVACAADGHTPVAGEQSALEPGAAPTTLCGAPVGQEGTLFRPGETSPPYKMHRVGNRTLTGQLSSYILWDAKTGTQVARGAGFAYGLTEERFVVGTLWSIEIRSAIDGSLVQSIDYPGGMNDGTRTTYYKGGLASDGSYLWLANIEGLRAWSLSGEPLISQTGDYTLAEPVAAPGELRVFGGPAGRDQVEILSPGKPPVLSAPVQPGDAFEGWFSDGESFVTTARTDAGPGQPPTIVRHTVYSKLGVAIGDAPLQWQGRDSERPDAQQMWGGDGHYFWMAGENGPSVQLNVFSIRAPAGLVEHYEYPSSGSMDSAIARAGRSVALMGDGFVDLVSFAGGQVQRQQVASLPRMPYELGKSTATSDEAGRWCISGWQGTLYCYDGASASPSGTFLGCGRPLSVASSTSGRFAAAFENGRVVIFDARETPKVVSVIEGVAADQMGFSRDGEYLGVETWRDVFHSKSAGASLFASVDGHRVGQWDEPYVSEFDVSNGARRIAFSSGDGARTQRVTDLAGTTYYTGESSLPIFLSPDGAHFARTESPKTTTAVIHIQADGAPVQQIPGTFAGWIDNERFLVQTYEGSPWPHYATSVIYNLRGEQLATPALPSPVIFPEQFSTYGAWLVNGEQLVNHNELFDLTTGALLKSYPDMTQGIAGNRRITTGGAFGDFLVGDL